MTWGGQSWIDNFTAFIPLTPGNLISAFRTPSPVSSLCFSPTGDFLATALADNVGIYLWANTTLYDAVSLSPLKADFIPKQEEKLPSSKIDKNLDEEENEVRAHIEHILEQSLRRMFLSFHRETHHA